MLKEEIRILGIDDCPLEKRKKKVMIIGTIFRGGKFMDGLLTTFIEKDGLDSTTKIASMINKSRHKPQIKVIMLDGITLAGFNIIDLKKLFELTSKPIIAINRKKPSLKDVKKALKNFKDFKKRWEMIKNAGKIKLFTMKKLKIYYQNFGIEDEEAEEVIRISCTHANFPEPLRIAHIIASGISKGESYGKA